jgi:hypothetical protein
LKNSYKNSHQQWLPNHTIIITYLNIPLMTTNAELKLKCLQMIMVVNSLIWISYKTKQANAEMQLRMLTKLTYIITKAYTPMMTKARNTNVQRQVLTLSTRTYAKDWWEYQIKESNLRSKCKASRVQYHKIRKLLWIYTSNLNSPSKKSFLLPSCQRS